MLDSQEHGTLHTQTPAATAAVCSRARAAGLLKQAAAQGRDLEASAPPLEDSDWLVTDGTRAWPAGLPQSRQLPKGLEARALLT